MGHPPFGPQPPPNFENLTPAQREWFKLQQEFFSEKRRKEEMDRMRHFQQMHQQMGGMGPGPGDGPYFRGMRPMRPGMPPGPMSPTSPPFGPPHGGPNDFMMGPAEILVEDPNLRGRCSSARLKRSTCSSGRCRWQQRSWNSR